MIRANTKRLTSLHTNHRLPPQKPNRKIPKHHNTRQCRVVRDLELVQITRHASLRKQILVRHRIICRVDLIVQPFVRAAVQVEIVPEGAGGVRWNGGCGKRGLVVLRGAVVEREDLWVGGLVD